VEDLARKYSVMQESRNWLRYPAEDEDVDLLELLRVVQKGNF
jgi:hypothetical protein